MKVNVILEHRFDRTSDGRVWTMTQFPYSFWHRYLAVFDSVQVVARVQDVPHQIDGALRVDGQGVSVLALPYYVGPLAFIKKVLPIRKILSRIVRERSALILRVPSTLGLTIPRRKLFERPYAVEVVGDPWEVFSPTVVKSPLSFLYRYGFTSGQKSQCAHASVASYVTREALQKRYPAVLEKWYSDVELPQLSNRVSISSIELQDEYLVTKPRNNKIKTIITIGSLNQNYKGTDILIDALAILFRRGIILYLSVVGDGVLRSALERQVIELGIEKQVTFHGLVPSGRPVFDLLDISDLFVLPSRTEGLPRAMIEAMARGLPCIGSSVGGIPELLLEEDLVVVGDARSLADKIADVLTDPARCHAMSKRNIDVAIDFSESVMGPRRKQFFQIIERQTLAWSTKTPE
jgi:glycosyltransferase involved in cell wall biosynthesis